MHFRAKLAQTLILGALLIAAFAAEIFAPAAAMAQADLGSVSGTITDGSGAVVPNATVTVKNTATGAERVTTSNSQGEYAVTQLPAADYTVSVKGSGFTT